MKDDAKNDDGTKLLEEELPPRSLNPSVEPEGASRRRNVATRRIRELAEDIEREFKAGHRVLSFAAYLELFASNPVRYGRSSAQYVRDMFVHYGMDRLERAWGKVTRFRLFDAPWDNTGTDARLLGQEKIQAEVFRVLSNFAREGRANRLILMHGPNGSAKSTAAGCILRALEHYSTQDEGAVYRFHWIFPNRQMSRGAIGFGGSDPAQDLESFAYLDDEEIDARLVIEVRDHPMFLIPGERRRPMLDELWSDAGAPGQPPEWLYTGELGHKNKQIFEALLAQYKGSLAEVLKHVQVERYFISRRYRVGAVTLGPEMSVDAGERQVTADRSLSSLPTSLQATTLFEAYGELVEAAGGVLEFSDLLKRPIDAFRYLQLTLETGEVSLQQQTVFTNVVMIGSANDIHMAAFREHPEYQSFRGRLELVRVPYLRSYLDEQAIYDTQIVPQLRRHVAPHTTRVVSEFAVLTRMRRPDASAYPKNLGDVVESLSAVEKMILYAEGKSPERLKSDERKLLRANIDLIWNETDSSIEYEGRVGVSPRQVRTLLLDAAQSEEYDCVSPFAVLKGIDELCRRASEFEWLKLKPLSGGYHDHQAFRQMVRQRLMDRIETDMREASGLIHAEQYGELFLRYLNHVSSWVKGEKMRNLVTGKDESPDEKLMREVESLLGVEGESREHRDGIISMVAAWVIEHPDGKPTPDEVFPVQVAKMQISAFGKRRKPFAALLRNIVRLLREDGRGLDAQARREVTEMIERLTKVGYADSSAADAASALLRDRYTDLIE